MGGTPRSTPSPHHALPPFFCPGAAVFPRRGALLFFPSLSILFFLGGGGGGVGVGGGGGGGFFFFFPLGVPPPPPQTNPLTSRLLSLSDHLVLPWPLSAFLDADRVKIAV